MSDASNSQRLPVSKMVIAFPVTYAIHIAEEFWMGEHFNNWLSRIANVHLTESRFLLLNSVFMIIMIFATIFSIVRRQHQIPLVLSSIVIMNTFLHVIGSMVTKSYSPGLISSVVLWLPLAIWIFNSERKTTSSIQKLLAIVIGIVAHIFVSMLALAE